MKVSAATFTLFWLADFKITRMPLLNKNKIQLLVWSVKLASWGRQINTAHMQIAAFFSILKQAFLEKNWELPTPHQYQMTWFGAGLWLVTTSGNKFPCATPGARGAKSEMEGGLNEPINQQQRRKQRLWWDSRLHQFLLRPLLRCSVKSTPFVRTYVAVRGQSSVNLFVAADLPLQSPVQR